MPVASVPITASDVLAITPGTGQWLEAAQASSISYDADRLASYIPMWVRRFEQETQFTVMPLQVCCDPDGSYENLAAGTSKDGTLDLEIEDAHDWYTSEASNEFMVATLYHRPVQTVQRVRIRMTEGHPLFTLPTEWYQINRTTGRFHVKPFTGSVIAFAASAYALPILMNYGYQNYIPGTMTFDYIAGLAVGWEKTRQWGALWRVLCEYCNSQVLQDISQAMLAGQASVSVGTDGVSQQWSPDRFAPRIAQLQQSVASYQETLRAQHVPFLMAAV